MLVAKLVKQLKELLVADNEIGIISPYNGQIKGLRKVLAPITKAEVLNVTDFQGKEKDVIILSMVKSNPERKVGLILNKQSLSLAVTRAKMFLAVICDSVTVSQNEFASKLIKHISRHGRVLNAKTFSDPDFKVSPGVFSNKKEQPKPKSPKKQPVIKPKVTNHKKTSTNKIDNFLYDTKEVNNFLYEEVKYDKEYKETLKLVDEFVKSGKEVFEFPELLMPCERMQVQKYIDAKYENIIPELIGNELDRRLVLKKSPEPEHISEDELALSPEQVKKQQIQEEMKRKLEIRKIQKRRAKERRIKLIKDNRQKHDQINEEEYDVAAFLKKLTKRNKNCNMEECSFKIEIFSKICGHCNKQYCLQHSDKSVHECPDKKEEPLRDYSPTPYKELREILESVRTLKTS